MSIQEEWNRPHAWQNEVILIMDSTAAAPTARPQPFLVTALAAALALLVVLPSAAASELGSAGGLEFAQNPGPIGTRLTVAPGQAELRRYSSEPGTIILGDPRVAAASIATSDVLVLTGLQPGETNVIVLDDSGDELDHITLRVVEPGNVIVVRRGQERELLRCDPVCAPIDEPRVAAPASRPNDAPQGAESPVAGGTAPPT